MRLPKVQETIRLQSLRVVGDDEVVDDEGGRTRLLETMKGGEAEKETVGEDERLKAFGILGVFQSSHRFQTHQWHRLLTPHLHLLLTPHMHLLLPSPASSSSSRSSNYDVFLSFRGEDTRKNFVDHLHSALIQKAIHTYKDDEKLPPGESIGPSLFKAVKKSQIAVIIFSKNYADSSWCLEELAYIIKCKDKRGLIVIPVFYDVEPSEVRKQKGDFGKGFAKQEVENIAKVESWRKALVAASEIGGWETKKIANGHESVVIKKIVDSILDRLLSLNPYVDEEFVGMTTRIQDLKSLLAIGSRGVRMVGIWGVGGGGKTTLATSLHMEISHHFEVSCILENIREESSIYGLKKLQENILSAVFKTEMKVPSVVEGKHKIRSMLCRRKVLLLLDDVDQLEQLEALAGSHNWFGSESRIIITTRDEHLIRTHKVDDIYLVKLLSDDESIRLFNKHAFNEKQPIEHYKTLSLHVVSYAAGLPLALKVLGSFLYDKDEKEWMSGLDRLKNIPEKEIVEKLKTSYDGLRKEEKELFLDIACFFRGWYSPKDADSYNAMERLDACGFHPEIGIKVLIQKVLINIGVNGKFEMHDLVQEMGHYIVRGEHPNNPEYHSRLWKEEEIRNMCLGDATKTNDKTEAMVLWYANANGEDVSRFCKNVSNMKKLRFLNATTFYAGDEEPSFLSNELRFICWSGYPGISFPDSFQPKKLVVLKLHGSLQEVLWKGYKDLPCLKALQLDRMMALVSTPDFRGLPYLKKLKLVECEELEKIHPSLGYHRSLEYVHVSLCRKLRKFPSIVHMEKLQTLEIMYCDKILEFPEIQENMESLVNLSLIDTGIEVLPSSIGERCTNITSLSLKYFGNLKSIGFNMDAFKHWNEFNSNSTSHTQLLLSESEMRFHQFSRSLQKLSNLEELDLSWNGFSKLDFSLLQLTRLKILNLEGCGRLVELPELPSSLAILKADYCESLTAVGDSLTNCKHLCHVSLEDGGLINDGDRVLESMLQGNIENGTMLLRLEGGLEIAKGFTPGLRRGNKCRLQLPEKWRNEFCGFLICAVGKSTFEYGDVEITVEQVKSGSMDSQREVVWEESDGAKVTWVAYISFASVRDSTPWWDQTYNELLFDIHSHGKSCSGFGVRLVGKKGENGSGTKDSSQFSSYTNGFSIHHASAYGLKINFSSC